MTSLQNTPELSTRAYIDECNAWRLAGAAVWHTGVYGLAAGAWLLLTPPGAAAAAPYPLLGLLLVLVSSFGVLLAQRRLLTTVDVPPFSVPRLGWGPRSWPCLLLARCVVRYRRPRDAVDVALLYGAVVGSAWLCLPLLSAPMAGNGAALPVLLLYGGILGSGHVTSHLLAAGNVIRFPSLQRPRLLRIKQRLISVARTALLLPVISLLPAIAAAAMLRVGQWGGLAGILDAWRAGVLLAAAWTGSCAVLEVVFSERLSLVADGHPTPTAPLLIALKHPDSVVQGAALLDLASVAEGAPGGAMRRAAVFADDSGEVAWLPLARYCLAELRDALSLLRVAMPSLAGAAPAAAAATGGSSAQGVGGGMRWNVHHAGGQGSGRTPPASGAYDAALWHLAARHSRLTACSRLLTGLAAAGAASDRYGLLTLCSPGLGDVLSVQLALVAALGALLRQSATLSLKPEGPLSRMAAVALLATASQAHSCSSTPASPAASLLDVAKTGAYRLANTYGAVLAGLLSDNGPSPGFGSLSEARALLASFLAGAE